MRHHSTPPTIASIGTVLSISPMRVSEAWRVEVVWDREMRDGGYGRSRRREERSWRRKLPFGESRRWFVTTDV